jgi:hypothetical protein
VRKLSRRPKGARGRQLGNIRSRSVGRDLGCGPAMMGPKPLPVCPSRSTSRLRSWHHAASDFSILPIATVKTYPCFAARGFETRDNARRLFRFAHVGSAHGVRKIAATRAANAGATVAQLEAIFGWRGGTMASLYTRTADRRRLALESMHKLSNDTGTSIVAPCYEVRQTERKEQ